MSAKYTPAQIRAIVWLPNDGSWRVDPDYLTSAALHSLRSYHPDLCEGGSGRFNKQGKTSDKGAWRQRFRLTSAGITEKAALK